MYRVIFVDGTEHTVENVNITYVIGNKDGFLKTVDGYYFLPENAAYFVYLQ